jgi:hypothetical protein
MNIIIDLQNGTQPTIVVPSGMARDRARLSFNPSGDPRVSQLKALAAAFYTLLEQIPEAVGNELQVIVGEGNAIPGRPIEIAKREAATAATHIQAGAMFAVSAATAAK